MGSGEAERKTMSLSLGVSGMERVGDEKIRGTVCVGRFLEMKPERSD